eukprot:1160428-Pelagomonas_calceolata.AAC.6
MAASFIQQLRVPLVSADCGRCLPGTWHDACMPIGSRSLNALLLRAAFLVALCCTCCAAPPFWALKRLDQCSFDT